MRTWGLWRYTPHPKRWIKDMLLPWSYLDAEPLDGGSPKRGVSPLRGFAMSPISRSVYDRPIQAGLDILERELRAADIPADGQMQDLPVGEMRTLRIRITVYGGRIPGGRRTRESLYLLVPPLIRFADLNSHFDIADVAGQVGDGSFYVNREVYEATGEFIQGNVLGSHHAVNAIDVQNSPMREMAGFVLTALDSFLERGGGADPRFNPPGDRAAFAKARSEIIDTLESHGWNVKRDLATPYATSPDEELRLWFKPQAVYFTWKSGRYTQTELEEGSNEPSYRRPWKGHRSADARSLNPWRDDATMQYLEHTAGIVGRRKPVSRGLDIRKLEEPIGEGFLAYIHREFPAVMFAL